MEATSVAGAKGRLDATHFAVLVFTNLTQDHLDFHGTMEAYFEAKAALFAQAERAVVNVDDEWGRRLADELPDADLHPGRRPRRIDLTCGAASTARTRSLPIWAAGELGVDDEAIRTGSSPSPASPGASRRRGGPAVHGHRRLRPHARLARERVPRRPRSRRRHASPSCSAQAATAIASKRALMGRVVRSSRTARSSPPTTRAREDPAAIAARGRRRGARARERARPPRRDPGWRSGARQGDVVVIAGKGADTEMELADRNVPFDDRVVAREIACGAA